MAKKVYFRKYKLNEDVNIPPELSDQYLSVKKQIEDKMKAIATEESKFAEISKKISQLKTEISIYQKNLIAIENKAKAINKEANDLQSEDNDEMQKSAEEIQKAADQVIQTIEASGNPPATNESIDLDAWWKENVTESIKEESPDIELVDDVEDAVEAEEAEDTVEADDSLEGDYAFAVTVIDEDEEEDIIAKFYKDKDDDFWKARVVQGSEEPIESMQFDPEMNKVDIIEHLATIFDEVIEKDVDEYEEDLDDKEFIDDLYYDDEKIEEGLKSNIKNLWKYGRRKQDLENIIPLIKQIAKQSKIRLDDSLLKLEYRGEDFIIDRNGKIIFPRGSEVFLDKPVARQLYNDILNNVGK
jgi:hypothetical protein